MPARRGRRSAAAEERRDEKRARIGERKRETKDMGEQPSSEPKSSELDASKRVTNGGGDQPSGAAALGEAGDGEAGVIQLCAGLRVGGEGSPGNATGGSD